MSKIKVGIVGTGSISNFHMAGYNNCPDAEVIACCDINEERAKAFAAKYGIKHVYKDYNEMLKLKELEAVSVTTWNNGHAPVAIAALKAGKHVLCEKPMALNTQQALEMEQAAKDAGKVLMVGFVRRFGQNVRIIKDFMNAGRFGDIYLIRTQCVRRAGNPCGWFSDKSRSGGGPVIDLGVHMIDLARFILGKPKCVSVYAATFNKIGTRLNLKDFPRYNPADVSDFCDVEDHAIAMIRFEGGAVCQVEVSFSQHIKEDVISFDMYGTKAGATLEPAIDIYSEMDDYVMDLKPRFAADPDPFTSNFKKEIPHFISCIKDGTQCLNPAEDGVELMKILDAIYESAKIGHEVIVK